MTLTFAGLLGYLAIAASSTVGTFVVLVGVDDVLGVVLALKTHTFDLHKLGSFLESQFGTRRAIALAGTVATAAISAAGAALIHGGLTQSALQGIADAALAAATAGAAAQLLAVVSDLAAKLQAIVGGAPAPAPGS